MVKFAGGRKSSVLGDGQADSWPTILSTFFLHIFGHVYFLELRTLVAKSVGGPEASSVSGVV